MIKEVKKILIAEDDDLISAMYTSKFKKAGFEVILAKDGQEAVQKTMETTPDLVLLDIVLPKQNGFDSLKAIKGNVNLEKIKVALLTNLGEAGDIKKGMDLGADAYLIKAHSTPSQIVEKVEDILKQGL